jgi:hypothetical protein
VHELLFLNLAAFCSENVFDDYHSIRDFCDDPFGAAASDERVISRLVIGTPIKRLRCRNVEVLAETVTNRARHPLFLHQRTRGLRRRKVVAYTPLKKCLLQQRT